ncbi:MAG: hypothetical protein ACXVDF_25405, partial [Ktedonobacterales bacterium]
FWNPTGFYGRSVQLEFPFTAVRPVTVPCSTYCGLRVLTITKLRERPHRGRRPAAFADAP